MLIITEVSIDRLQFADVACLYCGLYRQVSNRDMVSLYIGRLDRLQVAITNRSLSDYQINGGLCAVLW